MAAEPAEGGGCDGGAGPEDSQPSTTTQSTVRVICNGVQALFLLDESNFLCQCPACLKKALKGGPQVYTPTEYERHAGMAASKKWKYSVRIDDPEQNPDGGILTIGKWLDEQGLTHRKRPVKGGRGGSSSAKSGMARVCSGGVQQATGANPRAAPWGASNEPPDGGNEAYHANPLAQPEFSGRSGIPVSAGLLTPNGAEKRRWLLTQEQVAEQEALDPQHPDIPSTPIQHKVSRVGDDFQAPLPQLVKRTAEMLAKGDPRGGFPGPSEEEAMRIASEVEKAFADSMPRDAIADVHEEEPDPRQASVLGVRPGLLDRTQRVRRRPQWLSGNVNLYGIRRRRRADRDSEVQDAEEPDAEGEADPGAESEDDVQEGGDDGLTDTACKQPLQVPRMKRSRNLIRAASAFNISTAADLAGGVAAADLDIVQCRLSAAGASLFLKVCVKGVLFTGELPLESTTRPQQPRKPRGQRKRSIAQSSDTSLDGHLEASQAGSQVDGPGADAAASDHIAGNFETQHGKRQRALGTVKAQNNAGTEHRDAVGAVQPPPLSKRHAKAEERYRKLAEEGAPPDTLCSLCLLEEGETVEYDVLDGGEQAVRPLGKLLLVRTSTITHAWAHETCARWCPEVREVVAPKGEAGKDGPMALEGLAEAVRRGRRIKCTECGQRGATMGCHAKNCRKSYHLPCACVAGCLLEEDTMASFCSDHAEIHLMEREEAARSAERPPLKNEPSDATASKSTGAMSTESSAVEDEDKLAANILLGAVHRNAQLGGGTVHKVAPQSPAGTASQSRKQPVLPVQQALSAASPAHLGQTPVLGAGQPPAPLARGAVTQSADIKPPMLPGSTGTRTQRPRQAAPTGDQPIPLSAQPLAHSGTPCSTAAIPQGQAGNVYTMVGVPPAPVRSKRSSLTDASQNGIKARSLAQPGPQVLNLPVLTSPTTSMTQSSALPPSTSGLVGQGDMPWQVGRSDNAAVLFPPPFAAMGGTGRVSGTSVGAPAETLLAASVRRDVGHCQSTFPANPPLATPAPGPSSQ